MADANITAKTADRSIDEIVDHPAAHLRSMIDIKGPYTETDS